MTTRPIYTLFLVALMFTGNAFGRIGETVEQCAARYGSPISIDPSTGFHSYQKSGMDIICKFTDSKCALIVYTHTERDVLGRGSDMSSEEIDTLLQANGGTNIWRKQLSPVAKAWATADGSVNAQYDISKHMLVVITTAENRQDAARSAAADKARLRGF